MDPEELETLIRSATKRLLWQPGPGTRSVAFGHAEIERILPHREPFLFVDAITSIDRDQSCLQGHRAIDPHDPVFAGHFPGAPVYPGVLQIEIMGQCGICLTHFTQRHTDEI